ncbi:cutinase-domain-containing protein [Mycena galopus ATCC 62051]|nr:cutinase-domain-containing protein [Mycena galopus ATCC 62051]
MAIRVASLISLLGASLAAAQCPQVHVFGARETTVPPGYGTAGSVVSSIQSAFPGATAEAINYPACGGQASCGSVSYASSAVQGVAAVASQVNSFNSQCPNTVLVLVGYSQGGQIMDDAYCGGGDTNEGLTNTAIPISAAAQKKIAATSPAFRTMLEHAKPLFAPRPAGFQCPYAANIQSYCDAADPYCCKGSDANTDQGYAVEYGAVALTFVKNKVNAMLNGGGVTTPIGTTTTSPTSSPTGGTAAHWGQCGGSGWTGPTVCAAPYTCQQAKAYVRDLLCSVGPATD